MLPGVADLAGFAVTMVGPTTAAVATDSTGAFVFERAQIGRYAVSITVPSTTEGSSVTIVDVAGTDVVVPDFQFSPLGDVTGKVTLGAPTGNAGISVVVAGTAASAITDDSGTYVIRGVPAGARDVVAALPGWSGGVAKGVPVEYRRLATAPDVILTRAPVDAGSVEGAVKVSGEAANDGITVVAVGPSGTSAAITDAAGAWSVKSLAPGTYSITLSAPSTLEATRTAVAVVENGKTTTVEPVSFTPLGTLRGKATLQGRVSGNAGIMVWVTDSAVALTDDAGNWEIRGARTGISTVRATKEGYALGAIDGPTLAWRGVATVGTIDLALDPSAAASISGVAKVLGRTTNDDIVVSLSGSTATTTTAADGSYKLEVAASGLRSLSFKTKDGRYEARIDDVLLMPGGGAFVMAASTLRPIPLARLVRGKRIGRGRPVGATPSGEVVVFVPGTSGRFDVLSLTGTAKTLVASDVSYSESWLLSPDGAHLSYMRQTAAGRQWEIVSTAGGTPAVLSTASYSLPRQYLDGGKLLAYVTSDGYANTLNVRALATGKTTRVMDVGGYYGTMPCQFTRDVTYAACQAPSAGGAYHLAPVSEPGAITVVNVGYSRVEWTSDRRLVHSTAGAGLALTRPGATTIPERVLFTDGVIRWQLSPDAQSLLVWRQVGSQKSVWLVRPALSDAPVLVAETPSGAYMAEVPAAFSPDSSQVAWGVPSATGGPMTVRLANVTSLSASKLIGEVPVARSLEFLGASTVILGGRYESNPLRLLPIGGGASTLLGSALQWLPSPDASRLAWSEGSGYGSGPLKTATATGAISVVASTAYSSPPPQWSPDSARLSFWSCGAAECSLAVRDAAATSPAIPVTWQDRAMWLSPTSVVLSTSSYSEDDSIYLATLP